MKNLWLVMLLMGSFVACKVNQPVTESDNSNDVNEIRQQAEASESLPEQTYQSSKTRYFDLIHTRLDVAFDWDKKRLLGKADLWLRPYFYPQNKLVLDAKSFDVHELMLVKGGTSVPLKFEYDQQQITIFLDRLYKKDEEIHLNIKYTARPEDRITGGSAAITSDKGLYFINADGQDPHKPQQIWTQGETEASSCWFPTIDSPNERTTQEIYITVGDSLVTLSNGKMVSSLKNPDGTRTDYWKLDKPHAPYLFMMAIGDFAVVQDALDSIPVNYYVEPAYEKYARNIFGNTPEMISYFSELLDYPFPWNKYSQVVVRDYVSGAMENTTASIFMEDLQVDSRELLDYHWDDIIAHELFHQWFGNLVTCESWANLTLNEAFANYSEYLWREYKYGLDEADYHAMNEQDDYLEESKVKQVDLIRFYYHDKEDMFDSHSYAKGGRILHMLRRLVGDDAFFKSLNRYLTANAFTSVEVHDLRLAFEEVTGQDLNWFFNQWFLDSGHPELKIRHRYENGKLKLEVWQTQDLTKTPLYRLPVMFDFWHGQQRTRYEFTIEGSYQLMELDFATAPDLVVFDPNGNLLGEVDHLKSEAEWIAQYNNYQNFLPRYHALEALLDSTSSVEAQAVMIKALDDSFWANRQFALKAFEHYEGENFAPIEAKLIDMAKSDSESLVRADAVNLLSSIDVEKYEDVYRYGMNDSSYSVAGISLYGFAATQAPDKVEIFEKFEKSQNINLVLPLADFYAQTGQYDKYEWFEGKLFEINGGNLWYLIQMFGEFLMEAPAYVQKRGAGLLESMARNNNQYYVRLAAYQALGLLEDLDNMPAIRENIRKQEKDERLNQIYQNIP